jgi:hypothetical protein
LHPEARRNAVATLHRPLLVVLIVLNGVVLLGQVWPEGAPPFARTVNILFLVLSLGHLVWLSRRSSPPPS